MLRYQKERLLLSVFFLLLSGPVCQTQRVKTAQDRAVSKSRNAGAGEAEDFTARIAFRFDILDLVTGHQFEGQKNSFHVEYEYAAVLKGATFDPKGHAVPATTYPYFQSVRDTILDTI